MIAMRENLKVDGRTLSVLALVLALTPACITEPDTVDNDSSNVIVQVVSMAGQPIDNEGPGEPVVDLFSDVCFSTTGVGCSVFNDNGVVNLRAYPKDPSQTSADINSVVFERYRVTYVRADGKNVEGVDVPYAFDGAANFTVPVSGEAVERGFVVVRHQAKVETPLRELIGSTNFAIISTLARIDFYGRDGAGRTVVATAYLNITFADFGNAP
jgi:hypothetical protein